MEKLAKEHDCSPIQLSLAWILDQGDGVSPIPGTTKIKNLDTNFGSLGVKLREKDLKVTSDELPIDEVAGERISETFIRCSWKYVNTLPKDRNLSS